jgi:hypothetical protein
MLMQLKSAVNVYNAITKCTLPPLRDFHGRPTSNMGIVLDELAVPGNNIGFNPENTSHVDFNETALPPSPPVSCELEADPDSCIPEHLASLILLQM